MFLLNILVVLLQSAGSVFAIEVSRSSVGFVEMPESINNQWILKSPYGSEKAWGRTEMIRHLWLVCREWNRRYPDRPGIRIGDISKPRGGLFRPHNTHSVGLAVDIKTMPINIVDSKYEKQQQAIELAELFYTFGASLILYGQPHKFDGLPVVIPAKGHDTHFHVVINPDNVPSEGDWIFMPKITLVDPGNTGGSQGTVSIVISCELIGVAVEKNNQWKTILPTGLTNITFLLEDMHNSSDAILTYSDLIPRSATVKKQLTLKRNHKYRWRIMITTPSNQQIQSKWFLLDTSHNAQSGPKLSVFNASWDTNLPVHFTVLTRNPKASERITERYLKNELKALNTEYARLNPQNKTVFSFKSICSVNAVKGSKTRLSRLIDARRQYNRELWRKYVYLCYDPEVVDPSAINVFIYDAYSKKSGFSSKSTWLQRNCNRPYIFLDWQRTLNSNSFSSIIKEPQLVARYIGDKPRLLKN